MNSISRFINRCRIDLFSSTITGNNLSFKDYVLKDPVNRVMLIIVISIIVCELFVFKYFYPFAGFINGDSYAYIASGFYNLRVDTYPIGYPKFLRLVSVFCYNDTFLVVLQFLLIQLGLLFANLSLDYFYRFRLWVRAALLSVGVLNPVFLYLANYVSSDSLFLGLSFFWFGSLIWIINRPTLSVIVGHSILIFLTFTVRYNALFYPIITAFTLLMNRERVFLKIGGLILSVAMIGLFVNYTSNQWKRISGVKQFSPFTGWQLANNAMYAYKFVDSADRKDLPIRFKELDQSVRNFFDTTRDYEKYPLEMLKASTIYMWDPSSPLQKYMHSHAITQIDKKENVMWSKTAPILRDYGKILIQTYPKEYIENYLWANFLKYYAPPVEFLDSYSTNIDSVPPVAKQWFWYTNSKLEYKTKTMKVDTLNYYPVIVGISNALFLALSLVFLYVNGIRFSDRFFQFWAVTFAFWISNLGFSVFASPIALRFQLFPFLLSAILDLILIEMILVLGKRIEQKEIIARDTASSKVSEIELL